LEASENNTRRRKTMIYAHPIATVFFTIVAALALGFGTADAIVSITSPATPAGTVTVKQAATDCIDAAFAAQRAGRPIPVCSYS
jgi:hypothetical protein